LNAKLHDRQESMPVDEPRQRHQCDAGRVIGAPRLDLPLEVQRQLLAQEQIFRGEVRVRAPRGRNESQNVGGHAKDRADEDVGTGLGHAAGWYAADAHSR
jgi:hypothetical protein